MQDTGVVYLYRFAEGEAPVRCFMEGYGRHAAGVPHDLHVIFKGFADRDALARGKALFGDIPINLVELADEGFDIGSYRAAAKKVRNRRLLFLNTFSQILADDWLAPFTRALDLPAVGAVGATGSWLSNTSFYEAGIQSLLARIAGAPRRLVQKNPDVGRVPSARKRALQLYLLAAVDYWVRLYHYGRYPNPHLRTNAFMLERDRFLALDFPRFASKSDVYKFESGRRSLTRQILKMNLRPVVVDRQSRVHDITEWKSSSTFWIDNQINLLIADNRTMDYEQGDPHMRLQLENLAWVHPWQWYARLQGRSEQA